MPCRVGIPRTTRRASRRVARTTTSPSAFGRKPGIRHRKRSRPMDELAYRAAEGRLWKSVGVEPVERWLHLERNDVDVRVQEVGEGPPVLFIHGASTSGASWARLVARFPGYRCIVLDRP